MGQVTRTNYGISKITSIANAAVKTLPTIPVTLVEAIPGAVILPHLVSWILSPWTADYTNIDGGANMDVNINGAFTPPTFNPSVILAPGEAEVIWGEIGREWDFTAVHLADVQNQALVLSIDNAAAGNLTGGGDTMVLTVQVFYEVLRVA